jgi:hypothetical protein
MSYKQTKINFTDSTSAPVHSEENRLARRLFHLENRVHALESRVDEMAEMLQMIIMTDAFRDEGELSIGFCSCSGDEDEEDEEDEDEF